MASIPKNAIKELFSKSTGLAITDDGAELLANMLEEEARKISKSAVDNAKNDGRRKITKDDIIRCSSKG